MCRWSVESRSRHRLTEGQWLHDGNPERMLAFLMSRKASQRKLRLFAVAGCRRYQMLFADEPTRAGIRIAELFAEGGATAAELAQVHLAAAATFLTPASFREQLFARVCKDVTRAKGCCAAAKISLDLAMLAQRRIADRAVDDRPLESPIGDLLCLSQILYAAVASDRFWDHSPEGRVQSATIRKIFGNPFRRAALDHSWLAWNDRTIPKIAQPIYDEGTFERLPILADALEDAGCNITDILNHCRQPGDHVRGCWVVDLLLEKG